MGTATNDAIADVVNNGWTLTGGTGTVYSILVSSSTDASYASCPAGAGGAMTAFPKDVSLPNGAVVTSVSVIARAGYGASIGSVDPTLPPALTVDVVTSDNTSKSLSRNIFPTGTITTYTVGTYTRDASGAVWDVERLNRTYLRVRSSLGVADAMRVYRLYLVINYRVAPTVAVTAPTGTVTTPAPALSWVYSQSDGDALGSVAYKVFRQSQVSMTGFDPNATAPVFGATLNGDIQSLTLPFALTSDTYWLYVMVVSTYGAASPWTGRQFAVHASAPGVPWDVLGPGGSGVISTIEDDVQGNVEISVTNTSNLQGVQAAGSTNNLDGVEYTPTNCTITQDPAVPFSSGEYASWKIVATANGDAFGTGFWIDVEPGAPFTERVQFLAASGVKSCTVIAQFADSTYTLIGGADIQGSTMTDSASVWSEAVATGVVPLTASYMRIVPKVFAAVSGSANAHWFDHAGVMYGTGSSYSDGGMSSRNMLSTWYAEAEGTAPAGQSWTAAPGCTADTTAITGIGNITHRLTYNGVSPTIALRAAGTPYSTTASATAYTLNKPTGTLTGDLMVAVVSSSGTGTIHPPGGWTIVAQPQAASSGGNTSMWVLKRTFAVSDPTTWTDGYLSTAATDIYAVVVSYSGAADASQQFIADAAGQSPAASPAYVTNPSINNTDSNAWRISAFAVSSPTAAGSLASNQASPQQVPISYVGAATAWEDGGGWSNSPPFTMSFRINKPVGVQSGDLMIAALSFTGGAGFTVTPPTGWTQASSVVSGAATIVVMTRTAGGSEPTFWTSTMTTGSQGARSGARIVQCVAYRGAAAAGSQFVATGSGSVVGASAVSTPTVTNTDSRSWRVSIFMADSNHSGIWNASTEGIFRSNSSVYTTNALLGMDGNTMLFADSNGPVSSGSYSTEAWWVGQDSGFRQAVALELFIKSAGTVVTPGANETSRVSTTISSANPWLTTGVFDSNAAVAAGSTQTTGTFTPGSGSVVNSMVGWNGMIRPATSQPSGVASMTMATAVDISSVDPSVLTLCGNQVTVVASAAGASSAGTPYLTANFFRANVLISTATAIGTSFGVYPSGWVKSFATFGIPVGTTRINATLEVDGRPVSDAVYFKRVSLAFGADPTYRSGTAQASHTVWESPQIQYSDDAGSGFSDWADLQGIGINPPQYDYLSGTAVYFDETIIPLTPRKYRARTFVYGLAGDQFVSPWSSETAPSVFNGVNWWLKDLTTGDKLALKVQFQDLALATTGTAVSFQGLGEDLPMVVTEGFKGDTIKPTLRPVNRDDWLVLGRMLRSGNSLFLQTDYDQAWWVRTLSDIDYDVLASNLRQSKPIRDVTVTFLQIAPEN